MNCPTHNIPAIPGIFDGITKQHCPQCAWTAPLPSPVLPSAICHLPSPAPASPTSPTSQAGPTPRPLVIEAEHIHGGSGPDYVVLVLRDGRMIQIADDGITVWRNVASAATAFNQPSRPEHSIVFLP